MDDFKGPCFQHTQGDCQPGTHALPRRIMMFPVNSLPVCLPASLPPFLLFFPLLFLLLLYSIVLCFFTREECASKAKVGDSLDRAATVLPLRKLRCRIVKLQGHRPTCPLFTVGSPAHCMVPATWWAFKEYSLNARA